MTAAELILTPLPLSSLEESELLLEELFELLELLELSF